MKVIEVIRWAENDVSSTYAEFQCDIELPNFSNG